MALDDREGQNLKTFRKHNSGIYAYDEQGWGWVEILGGPYESREKARAAHPDADRVHRFPEGPR